jgi:hypothetical protein
MDLAHRERGRKIAQHFPHFARRGAERFARDFDLKLS